MKTYTLLILVLLLSLASADETISYEFSYPIIEKDGKYSKIDINDCIILGEEGYPAIPVRPCSVLLKAGESASSAEIIDISYYQEEEFIRIKPCGSAVPLSRIDQISKEVNENEIYKRDEIYPFEKVETLGTGYLCGHPIAYFCLNPVEYNPVSGLARFIKNIEVKIITGRSDKSQEALQLLRHDRRVIGRLEKSVDNPCRIGSYAETNQFRVQEYDILLITKEALYDEYLEYKSYKESCGYYTKILTTEEIYEIYTGAESQTRIRNAIIEYYQNSGISYVILAGDSNPVNQSDNSIPHRGLYSEAGEDIDYDIAADLYYGCLDGTWNDDNDEIWGEWFESDPYYEVNVGRFCSEEQFEADSIRDKILMYEDEPVVESINNFLMVGEHLWFETIYGGMYLWEISHGGMYNGYYTAGFPDNINVIELYEMYEYWSDQDLLDAINSGVNMIHHMGHGNTTTCLRINNGGIYAITNDGLSAGFNTIYSQACYSASFDNRVTQAGSYTCDCFAEEIIGWEYGACGFIGNSRYGWGDNTGTNGHSQTFHRYFSDAMFGEDITIIGDALTHSKEVLAAGCISNSVYRWVYYELNLLGDPTMDIYTAPPHNMILEYPESVDLGIREISVNSALGNYRAGVLQNGELLGRGVADDSGYLTLELDEPIVNANPLTITAKAHNYYRFEETIAVNTDIPCVIFDYCEIDEISGNGNGLPDYSETIGIDLNLSNIGNLSAENIDITAISDDEYITFIDSVVSVSEILENSSITIEDAINFEIANNIPDQHSINITLIISEDSGYEWEYDFHITAYAPELHYIRLDIDDSNSGNNNGFLDPGETAEASIEVRNSGHSISPEAEFMLTSNNTGITITGLNVTPGQIEPSETVYGSFSIQLEDSVTSGEAVEFVIIFNCGEYCFSDTLTKYPGIYIEDFENGDYQTFCWEFTGTNDWTIDDNAYEGRYAAHTGNLEYQQSSGLRLEFDAFYDDSLSFYFKTSCHNCDNLSLFIDSLLIEEWSGTHDWQYESYYMRYGHHIVEWVFDKNHYNYNGEDCAWLDNIIFPQFGVPESPELYVNTNCIDIDCSLGEILESSISMENTGGGTILYDLAVSPVQSRDISSCWLDINTHSFEPGSYEEWALTAFNETLDNEWIYRIEMQLPEGVSLEYAENFTVEFNRRLDWDEVTGNGITAAWETRLPDGSGVLRNGEQATAVISTAISENFTGVLNLPYTIYGDGYGNDPHTVCDTLTLISSFSWIALDTQHGALNGGETKDINLIIDSNYLTEGIHQCEIIISSIDIEEDVYIPVTVYVDPANIQNSKIPQTTEITACYPNPFNPVSYINYQIKENSLVNINIYNIKGQLIKTLVSEYQDPASYQIIWNGLNNSGSPAASGVYFYRLKTEEHDIYQKVLLLK